MNEQHHRVQLKHGFRLQNQIKISPLDSIYKGLIKQKIMMVMIWIRQRLENLLLFANSLSHRSKIKMKRSTFFRKGESCVSRVILLSIRFSDLSIGPPRLTAIVISVSSLNVGAMGTGFNTPPSMRLTPLYLKGVKKRGSDIEALMASNRLPELIQTPFSF